MKQPRKVYQFEYAKCPVGHELILIEEGLGLCQFIDHAQATYKHRTVRCGDERKWIKLDLPVYSKADVWSVDFRCVYCGEPAQPEWLLWQAWHIQQQFVSGEMRYQPTVICNGPNKMLVMLEAKRFIRRLRKEAHMALASR